MRSKGRIDWSTLFCHTVAAATIAYLVWQIVFRFR